jgi:hypothetical protein
VSIVCVPSLRRIFNGLLCVSSSASPPVSAIIFPGGLEFDLFPGSDSKFLIMVATPTRHHQFIGGPTIEAALATYTATPKTPAKALPKFIELPATLSYSSMQTFESESDGGSGAGGESGGASCAWLTGVGVFYANMVFGAQNPGDGVFSQSKLLPFPSEAVVSGGLAPALSGNGAEQDQGVAPRSLSLTEFHFLLLYKNRLLAINRLSEDVVWTLPVQPERTGYGSNSSSAAGGSGLLGFARDATHQCIFAYSDRAVFEIGIDHEDRDVWRLCVSCFLSVFFLPLFLPLSSKPVRSLFWSLAVLFIFHMFLISQVYLSTHYISLSLSFCVRHMQNPNKHRYLEDGNFAAALERCHDAQQEESVREAEADSHFEKGQFEHAARLYAQTSRRCVHWVFV